MKKFIIATAILLTTGIVAVTSKSNAAKTTRIVKTEVSIDNNILATAD